MEQHRNSRLKESRHFIENNASASLMNNIKWAKVFDFIEANRIGFELKTVLSNESQHCEFIRELEKTSLLIDDTGNFIEFLEIFEVAIPSSEQLEIFLKTLNIEPLKKNNQFVVSGYSF